MPNNTIARNAQMAMPCNGATPGGHDSRNVCQNGCRPHLVTSAHESKCTGRFSFAVTGVNHQQTSRLFLIILAAPLVFLFLARHKEMSDMLQLVGKHLR